MKADVFRQMFGPLAPLAEALAERVADLLLEKMAATPALCTTTKPYPGVSRRRHNEISSAAFRGGDTRVEKVGRVWKAPRELFVVKPWTPEGAIAEAMARQRRRAP